MYKVHVHVYCCMYIVYTLRCECAHSKSYVIMNSYVHIMYLVVQLTVMLIKRIMSSSLILISDRKRLRY